MSNETMTVASALEVLEDTARHVDSPLDHAIRVVAARLRGEAAQGRPFVGCQCPECGAEYVASAAQPEQQGQAVATIESVDGRSHIHLTWHTPWGELKAGDRLYNRPQPVAGDAVRALRMIREVAARVADRSDMLALYEAHAALSAAPAAPALHVGESAFESWYSGYEGNMRDTSPKQLARDAYAAGMGKPAPAPVAGDAVPRMLILGREYATRGGATVKLVSIHNAGTHHETMACAEGVSRYTRRLDPLNFGRVTGTDGTDPRDLIAPPVVAYVRAPVAGDAVAKLPEKWRKLESTMRDAVQIGEANAVEALRDALETALAQDRASQAGTAGGVPDALEWLRLKLLSEPVRRAKIGGQTHSYFDAGEVIGWVEEAQKRAAKQPAAEREVS